MYQGNVLDGAPIDTEYYVHIYANRRVRYWVEHGAYERGTENNSTWLEGETLMVAQNVKPSGALSMSRSSKIHALAQRAAQYTRAQKIRVAPAILALSYADEAYFAEELPFPKFPETLKKFAWSSTKKMEWKATAVRSGSGKVRTHIVQDYADWKFIVKLNHMIDTDAKAFFDFVQETRGVARPFLWLDPELHEMKKATLERQAKGAYQVFLQFGDYRELAAYIELKSVYLDGVKLEKGRYSVKGTMVYLRDEKGEKLDVLTGRVSADYKYWWKVRFESDGQGIERIFEKFNRSKTFSLKVVR